jgi:LmbE family N-acetylglucosaminyl deacetylase
MNVLVLAAHPDDEVLGCGGTIARLVKEGHTVHISIFGEGITSRYDQREKADPGLVSELHGRAQAVADYLGASELILHSLPDNRFDTVPMLDVVKLIERLVERLQPEVVYTQHGGDLNIDHVVLFRATLAATRPTGDCPVREVYAYEVNSSTEWAFQKFEPSFHPNVFVNIGETLERKVHAMQLYESEARPFPHPRAPEALRAAAWRWGSTAGVAAAEAFELVRGIR